MSVRSFSTVGYLPITSVRPAEMTALEELPDRDKDQLLPLIPIGTWMSSHRLQSTLSRIESAYSFRPIIADLSLDRPQTTRRPVHNELDDLRNSAHGYANWCNFIENQSNYIPAVQFLDLDNVRMQVRRFASMGREVALRIPEPILGQAPDLARLLFEEIEPQKVCVILDFEKQNRHLLTRQAVATGIINSIRAHAQDCYIALSASSFPESFVGLDAQEIFERQFFNGIANVVGKSSLIYSDRGSARAERLGGGGGSPAPRVDYACSADWSFFREEIDPDDDRFAAYQRVANRTLASPVWDPALNLWGSQLITRTAQGDPSAINSPQVSTAARINIHLHQQLLYGASPEQFYDTDDDWSD